MKTFITVIDSCDINAPTASSEIDRKSVLSPWGYAFDKTKGKIPGQIYLQIVSDDNKNGLLTPMKRMSRPDVAKAFGLPIEMAGFGGDIVLKELPPGPYNVSLIQKDEEKIMVCSHSSKVILK